MTDLHKNVFENEIIDILKVKQEDTNLFNCQLENNAFLEDVLNNLLEDDDQEHSENFSLSDGQSSALAQNDDGDEKIDVVGVENDWPPQAKLINSVENEHSISSRFSQNSLEMINTKIKRINTYKPEYSLRFKSIRPSEKGETFALCTACGTHISLGNIGISAITQHQKSLKHKAALETSSNIKISDFRNTYYRPQNRFQKPNTDLTVQDEGFSNHKFHRRSNVHREKFELIIQGIRRFNKDPRFAHCISCDDAFSLGYNRKTAIMLHLKTEKHRKSLNFHSWTGEVRKNLADEVLSSYHIVMHGNRICFSDENCLSSIKNGFFKSSDPRRRSQLQMASDLTQVLGPWSIEEIAKEVGNQQFSLLFGTSYFNAGQKFVPLVIRFFHPQKGVRSLLLDAHFYDKEEDNNPTLFDWIAASLSRWGLDEKRLVSIFSENSAILDDVSSNDDFKQILGSNVISSVSSSQLLSDILRNGSEQLHLDIESVVLKLIMHFRSPASRGVEIVGELCEIADELDETKIRSPARLPPSLFSYRKFISKIFDSWDSLSAHFSVKNGPKIFCQFFTFSKCKVVTAFVVDILNIFSPAMETFQKEKALLPEVLIEMERLVKEIKNRFNHKFYGSLVGELMQSLPAEGVAFLQNEFQEFYRIAHTQTTAWMNSHKKRFPANTAWSLLAQPKIQFSKILELAQHLIPELCIKQLKVETSQASKILSSIKAKEFAMLTFEEKWSRVFALFEKPTAETTGCQSYLLRLVSYVACIPVSSSFLQRAFFVLGGLASDEQIGSLNDTKNENLRNSLVREIARIRINFSGITCPEMYRRFYANERVLSALFVEKQMFLTNVMANEETSDQQICDEAKVTNFDKSPANKLKKKSSGKSRKRLSTFSPTSSQFAAFKNSRKSLMEEPSMLSNSKASNDVKDAESTRKNNFPIIIVQKAQTTSLF